MYTEQLWKIRKKETGITIHVNEHYDEGCYFSEIS
jgi:hypothetical protein